MILNHLNALRALEASIRLGSSSAAARELNVTPAAVGQQVKKLENFLGVRLLNRNPNGFSPTPIASQVASKLHLGFGQIEEAGQLMAQRYTANQQAISVVPTIAENWLAPRLPDFLQQQPGIDLRIDSTSTILNPEESHFDFALRYGSEAPEGSDVADLFPDYLLPVCTPELAQRMDIGNGENPFGDVPLLHTERSTSDPDWMHWPEWCEAMGYGCPEPAGGVKHTFTTLAIRAMFAGQGVHLAQLSITLPAIAAGRLVAPFGAVRSVRTGLPYRLVQLNARGAPSLHERFRAWVTTESAETTISISDLLAS